MLDIIPDNNGPEFSLFVVRVLLDSRLIQLQAMYPTLTVDTAKIFCGASGSLVDVSCANQEMVKWCQAISREISPENCTQFNDVVRLLLESANKYRGATRAAMLMHLLIARRGNQYESE